MWGAVIGAGLSLAGGMMGSSAKDKANAYNQWRDDQDRKMAQKEYKEKKLRTEGLMAQTAAESIGAGQRAAAPLIAQAVELRRGASRSGADTALQLQEALRKQSGAVQQQEMFGQPGMSSKLGVINSLYSGQALLGQQQARLGRYEKMTALSQNARMQAGNTMMQGVGGATTARLQGMNTLAGLSGLHKTGFQDDGIDPMAQALTGMGSALLGNEALFT